MNNGIGIVGGGIIGSAVAFELTRRGVTPVHVFDPDLEGSLSSTERNAGGVRHLWINPINAELSRISINFFESIRAEIGFHQTGYLWLYPETTRDLGEKALTLSQGRSLPYEQLSRSEISHRYPFIDHTDDIAFGLFGRKDGILNSNSLKNFFQREAKLKGAVFHDHSLVCSLSEEASSANLMVLKMDRNSAHDHLCANSDRFKGTERRHFDQVIVCAGAWSSRLLNSLGVKSITRAVRRQIAIFKIEGLDLTPYGMIVDTSGVYFHAEGGNCLAGLVLKDEPEGFNFQYDSDFFESNVWPALYHRSSHMERLKPLNGWSGLYSYSPDITGILGAVPGFKRVYESHSYTGHGIMHSFGAAIALVDLIIDGRFSSIDATPLSRDRFRTGKLLDERLHI